MRRSFEAMLSGAVDAFLAERGFERLGNDFDRHRGPLRDRINFQNNWHNGVTPWHGFFVNVGVGSAEVDAACPGHEHQLHPPESFLLDRRWESLAPGAPYELGFDRNTDMVAFADGVCADLGRTLSAIETMETTRHLVEYAVGNNLLIAYETTCCYLAATGDMDTLTRYVALLHRTFGRQERWSIFSSRISDAVGSRASALSARGLLIAVGS
ncbi:DUF4304 domain-containing protein [Mycolicibacterium austroafricanum]|uniref:DUF4304 domain-containing protein n=1 Tax=Mycolicibacterium austroafricanum TaxID=39687 RepID=UPI001F167FA3|nr:DUF4304 domain-containing protein [Mycolicibacterium austroafricanum]